MFKLLILSLGSIVGFTGCAMNQCQIANKTLASAEAAYVESVKSGSIESAEKFGWSLDASKAIVNIWCGTEPK